MRFARSLHRGTLAAVIALACLVLPMAVDNRAAAASPSPSPGTGTAGVGAATVSECLGAGQVWLVVQTDTAVVLRSECVGRPATGQAALEAADVAVTLSSGGYLCTLAGYPSRCLSSYRGQYWQYWHAAGVGQAWVYSQEGAATSVPQPGSIEGWCYNSKDADSCRPLSVAATDAASPRVDLPPARDPSPQFTGWVAGAVLLLTAIIFVIGRRRRAGGARRGSVRR